jgi:hypothetical protein
MKTVEMDYFRPTSLHYTEVLPGCSCPKLLSIALRRTETAFETPESITTYTEVSGYETLCWSISFRDCSE